MVDKKYSENTETTHHDYSTKSEFCSSVDISPLMGIGHNRDPHRHHLHHDSHRFYRPDHCHEDSIIHPTPTDSLTHMETQRKPMRLRVAGPAAINRNLSRLSTQHYHQHKKSIRGASRKRKPVNVVDTDSSSSGNGKPAQTLVRVNNTDPGVASSTNSSDSRPPSFLLTFPTMENVDPLNKVLEPTSISHLDLSDECDADFERARQPQRCYERFTRASSFSAAEDPGVIGPVVWNMHIENQKRLEHAVSVDEGTKITNNVAKMRKRFHDLLDDTFSLFGSRKTSPVIQRKFEDRMIEVKSHSAIDKPSQPHNISVRPKTSYPARNPPGVSINQPKSAWRSTAPSPSARPFSAPFVRPTNTPRINVEQVLADGTFPPNDPAVPLIAAIKQEIGKCSLPGSTNNLVQ